MKSPSIFANDSYGFSLFQSCTHISVISLSIPICIGISFFLMFRFFLVSVCTFIWYQVNTINITNCTFLCAYFSLLVRYQVNTINILQIVAKKHINTISNIVFCLLLSSSQISLLVLIDMIWRLYQYLDFSSPELKTQMSFSGNLLQNLIIILIQNIPIWRYLTFV